MYKPRTLVPIATLIVAAVQLACASGGAAPPGKTVGSADIAAAEARGELDSFYADLGGRIAASTSEEQASQLRAVQRRVGDKLAERAAAALRRELAEAPRSDELIPLDVLETLRVKADSIRRWSTDIHGQVDAEVSAEAKKTRGAVSKHEQELASMALDDVPGRLALLEMLGVLVGPNSERGLNYAAERRSLVDKLRAQAASAIEAENYNEARRMLAIVKDVDPTNPKTAESLATVDTKVFERDFFHALEAGEPDKGYALLTSISSSENFPLIRSGLASSTAAMTKYYVSLGATAAAKRDIPEAYRRFAQARKIRALLGEGGSARGPAEEKALIALLYGKFEKARAADQLGLAWGYLHVIASMQREGPKLRRSLRETRERILQRAVKRLSVASFDSADEQNSEYGDGVASRVVQHLIESIPNDVRMIEREELSDIMREKKLGKDQEGRLAAVDYLVHGTILEAKVDTSVRSSKENRRVVTEHIEQRNPDYDAWFKLDAKKREEAPEPPKTITVPHKENIAIEVLLHRKVGLFAVSFRVIDAKTAKVIFADSVRSKVVREDTSNEGYTYAEFQLKSKRENLPSDTEMLAELTDTVSEQIGDRIADKLRNPEIQYVALADRYAQEANYERAAQQYAWAIVLTERKRQDVGELKEKLRRAAIDQSAL